MQLPTAREINPVAENLDGQYAERHFLGKTVGDAVALFEEQFMVYSEDLLHMGVGAFIYYSPAAIAYAESGGGKYDCDVAHQLLSVLSHRWHYESSELGEVRELFRLYCERVIARMDEMNIESHVDYRLERQFQRFLHRLTLI